MKLQNTDEDRLLRERFRDHPEYDRLTAWPVKELFDEIGQFLDEVIGGSTEYQDTLVKADDVHARLLCWGGVGINSRLESSITICNYYSRSLIHESQLECNLKFFRFAKT